LKILLDTEGLDLVAVNDIAQADNLSYLIKYDEYDTVYGRYHREVRAADGALHVDGTPIATFAERDPPKLPWADLAVNLVFECAGVFKEEAGLTKHLQAGASYVILSAPTTSDAVATVVHGVNRAEPAPSNIRSLRWSTAGGTR